MSVHRFIIIPSYLTSEFLLGLRELAYIDSLKTMIMSWILQSTSLSDILVLTGSTKIPDCSIGPSNVTFENLYVCDYDTPLYSRSPT